MFLTKYREKYFILLCDIRPHVYTHTLILLRVQTLDENFGNLRDRQFPHDKVKKFKFARIPFKAGRIHMKIARYFYIYILGYPESNDVF